MEERRKKEEIVVDEMIAVKEEKDKGNTKKKLRSGRIFGQKHHYTILIWTLLLSHRKRVFYNRIMLGI